MSKRSKDWTLEDVQNVVKKRKNGRARDQDDYNFELFKPNLAGLDLTRSLKMMFNNIISELYIPEFVQKMTVTSLYKHKWIFLPA